MKLRRAHLEDARGIIDVHRRAVMAVDEPRYDDETLESWSPPVTEERVDTLADDLESEELVYFVFEDADGEIAGFSCAVPDDGEIRAVYVDPERSRRGLGSALLRQAEWAATQSGRDELELYASLNAVPFYESHGYERKGEVDHEFDDGTQIPCVEMTKKAEQGMEETW